jgi:ribosomal protein S18 acetylase RimI-like enzyme
MAAQQLETVEIAPVGRGCRGAVDLARAFRGGGRRLDAANEAALIAITRGEPLARAWLVRVADRPVGYLILTLGYNVEYGGRDGFIDDLYVAPDARGRGLGRNLLDHVFAEAVGLGIRTLHLEVETDNGRAACLYRSAGFEETGRRFAKPLL